MTEFRRRALTWLRDHPGLRATEFARAMWPDNPKWDAHYGCGSHGSTRGAGVVMSGGSYLGKLRKDGLAYCRWTDLGVPQWYATAKGIHALREDT